MKISTQSNWEILKQNVLWLLKFRAEIQSSQMFSYTFYSLPFKKSISIWHQIFKMPHTAMNVIANLSMVMTICKWFLSDSLMFSAASTYSGVPNCMVSFLIHTAFEEGFEFEVFEILKWQTFWSSVFSVSQWKEIFDRLKHSLRGWITEFQKCTLGLGSDKFGKEFTLKLCFSLGAAGVQYGKCCCCNGQQ